MEGRFPFDGPGRTQQHHQKNYADLTPEERALSLAMFRQRQGAMAAAFRDYELRQRLLQDHIDLQLQEQAQLRAIGEQLHEYPDLQQHYHNMLLNEQLQRQQQQEAEERAYLREQQQQHQAAQLRYQEALTRQLTAAAKEEPAGIQRQPKAASSASGGVGVSGSLPASATSCAARYRDLPVTHPTSNGSIGKNGTSDGHAIASAASGSMEERDLKLQGDCSIVSSRKKRSCSRSSSDEEAFENKKQRSTSCETSSAVTIMAPRRSARQETLNSPNLKAVDTSPIKRTAENLGSRLSKPQQHDSSAPSGAPVDSKEMMYLTDDLSRPNATTNERYSPSIHSPAEDDKQSAKKLSVLTSLPITRKGTLQELLEAAEAENKVDDAVEALAVSFGEVEWSDSEPDEDSIGSNCSSNIQDRSLCFQVGGLDIPTQLAENVRVGYFHSEVPSLPEEPVISLPRQDNSKGCEDFVSYRYFAAKVGNDDSSVDQFDIARYPSCRKTIIKEAPLTPGIAEHASEEPFVSRRPKIVSTLLEYPYQADTWWPSAAGMRRERHHLGETSDEEDFVEFSMSLSRKRRIWSHLAHDLEPGMLEKLPHCRLHRIRTKRKKGSAPAELAYCFQLTEIYPHDIMVNCSVCGSWRHAACGGHFNPYSSRKNIHIPFVAVCEHCYEEEGYLRKYPLGEVRLKRQRTEQLRRSMITSALMRHASFSKHGGTYKWPLGSVSATHIGGHTRSVHARHDKAEKQWTDMATRLGRGYGYRPKERVRVRTKELERLLVSVEDAEGYTDRHNMLLFLMRDSSRDQPFGFEDRRQNLFDPTEDDQACPTIDDHRTETGMGSAAESKSLDLPHLSGLISQTSILPLLSEEKVSEQESQGFSCGAYSLLGEDNKPWHCPHGESGTNAAVCIRQYCTRVRRCDSVFCSDACGVAVLEMDLLRTFQDASDIHPSVLRH